MMGPFQVTCVLAAVLAAAFSTSTALAREGRGNLLLPDKPNLVASLGDRINSNTTPLVSGNSAERPGRRS
jgi:hypothetical protein